MFASAFILSSSAFILSSSAFHLLRLSSGALSLLSSACPVCLFCLFLCLCGSLCFLFPFRTTRKKKGRTVLVRPLLPYCVCSDSCTVIEKLFRCVFGFFQFVRLVMPTNTGSIRRFARFHFDFVRHYIDITYNSSAFLK